MLISSKIDIIDHVTQNNRFATSQLSIVEEGTRPRLLFPLLVVICFGERCCVTAFPNLLPGSLVVVCGALLKNP
jgi:hypothetical protein